MKFHRDCLESVDQFREYCHLKNIVFWSMIKGIYLLRSLNSFRRIYEYKFQEFYEYKFYTSFAKFIPKYFSF